MDLPLNNLQRLICHKTKQTKPSIYLSIYLSISVSIYLSIYLSQSVSIYLSIYLSLFMFIYPQNFTTTLSLMPFNFFFFFLSFFLSFFLITLYHFLSFYIRPSLCIRFEKCLCLFLMAVDIRECPDLHIISKIDWNSHFLFISFTNFCVT